MEYCRSLKFEQEPNYKQCIGLFENCLARHNFDAKVFLRGDRTLLYGDVMGVMADLASAGYTRMRLVTEQPEGSR